MTNKRVCEILKNKDIKEIYYNDQPVWIQEVHGNKATVGFVGSNDTKDLYIKELYEILGKTHISDFYKFCVEQIGSMDPEQNAFSEYIKDLLKEKRITQQMVFLKADIPEKYGYKLLSGEKHTRQRDIILRICYAAELTLEQTQRALRKYEMPQPIAKFP